MYTDYLFPPSALSVESASLYYLTLISLIPQIFYCPQISTDDHRFFRFIREICSSFVVPCFLLVGCRLSKSASRLPLLFYGAKEFSSLRSSKTSHKSVQNLSNLMFFFVGVVLICKISRPRATAHRCTKIYTDYLFPPSALSVESASLYYLTLISLIPQIFSFHS